MYVRSVRHTSLYRLFSVLCRGYQGLLVACGMPRVPPEVVREPTVIGCRRKLFFLGLPCVRRVASHGVPPEGV